ncbi:MAG: hypothetical protein J3K34DRAFT_431857 [Monoraphidium minutum]|nr:MAG: hypothetical protein J3K34DRAFT_431857 [Monoraphidium minutum]
MRVLTTSSGVVAAAAAAPALPPISRSSTVDGWRPFVARPWMQRIVSYTANLTAMSGTSSMMVGKKPVHSPRAPAEAVMDFAAAITLGYTPACTLRMQTAIGTLTTPLPTAATPPDTNAIWPSPRRVRRRSALLVVEYTAK